MLTIKKQQIEIIECTNGMECQERLNHFLDSHARCNPTIEREVNRPFCFYVYYEVEETIAETKSDEYRLSGYNLYCEDCPHFVLPDDKRLKCRCGRTHRHVNFSDYICDEGIEALEQTDKIRRGA